MSLFGTARLNARRDKNEPVIVAALEREGCLVEKVSGKGIPDLCVWAPALKRIVLLEVKDGTKAVSARKLQPDQEIFHTKWKDAGAPVHKVANVVEALNAVGVKVKRGKS